MVYWDVPDGTIRAVEWDCLAAADSFDLTRIVVSERWDGDIIGTWNGKVRQFDLLTVDAVGRHAIRPEAPFEIRDRPISVSHDGVFIAAQVQRLLPHLRAPTWMQQLVHWLTGEDSVSASLIGHRCSDGRELWRLPVETKVLHKFQTKVPVDLCVSPRGDAVAMERLAGGIDIYDLPPRRSWAAILIAALPLALLVGVSLRRFEASGNSR